jgi:hypothetical protein
MDIYASLLLIVNFRVCISIILISDYLLMCVLFSNADLIVVLKIKPTRCTNFSNLFLE